MRLRLARALHGFTTYNIASRILEHSHHQLIGRSLLRVSESSRKTLTIAIITHVEKNFYFFSRQEVRILIEKSFLLSILESLRVTVTPVATLTSILTLIATGQVLTPEKVFMLLSFFVLLRTTWIVRGISFVMELFVALNRIEMFLLLGNLPSVSNYDNLSEDESKEFSSAKQTTTDPTRVLLQNRPSKQNTIPHVSINREKKGNYFEKTDKVLTVSNLSCKEHELSEKFFLQDVSFQAPERSLTVITGPVGGGKSTLLASIVGETKTSAGSIAYDGSIAYVSQTAWVFSGTLRENILFGEPYDQNKLSMVIGACALQEDLSRFPKGLLTFVGERGVVLSGGQRTRVSLARAVYADADMYLLDDPLSAVDAKVGEQIFNQCICQLLSDRIRIMVTHDENHMKVADQIIVLHKGSLLGKGTLPEVETFLSMLYSSYKATILGRKLSLQQKDDRSSTPPEENELEHLEISEEDRAIGTISLKLYWDYFKAGMHPVALCAIIFVFILSQGKQEFY